MFAVDFDSNRHVGLAEVSVEIVLLVELIRVGLGRTVAGAASALSGHGLFGSPIARRAQSAVLRVLAGGCWDDHAGLVLAAFMRIRAVGVR